MIRSALLSSAALVALSVVASAADLPTRKAPVSPYVSAPVFTWTGLYVGGQIGAGWSRDSVTTLGVVGAGSLNTSGIIGGLHAGYNQQFGQIVLGIEGDIEAVNLKTTALISTTQTSQINPQGSIRGRLGYAIDNALIYATGGVAFETFKTSYPVSGLSFQTSRTGWTLGGGLEYALTKNWTARVEYRYANFGNVTDSAVVGVGLGGGVTSSRHSISEQAVRVGVSYKFDTMAGPVVAKY